MKAKPTSPEARPRHMIASVEQGLAVLEVLAEHGPEMSLATLSKHMHRPKPTVWRLVHTLVRLGYVRQDAETRRFALTPRILALGACFDGMDLKEIAAPFLRELVERSGETVNMAVRDEDNIIYIERLKTSQIININLHVGSRLPLYNTSMGRALIAHMPEEWLRQYLSRIASDPAARPFVQGGGARLLTILREARQRGYAVNNEELSPGLRSVASPIWDGSGREVVAAVNIAVPSARVTLRELNSHHLPELLKTTKAISAALSLRVQRTLKPASHERLASYV
jgi:IclR family transcriptional regulator, pca regulon regulatory protein